MYINSPEPSVKPVADHEQFSLRGWLKRWSRLLPSTCALCGFTGPDTLCTACAKQYLSREVCRCQQCGIALAYSADERCGTCLRDAPAFDATIAATNYVPPVDHLVLALKFGGRLELADLMARHLEATIRRTHAVNMPDFLTAVPLGPQRLIDRGFNQALEIAKPLARSLDVPLLPKLLMRQRDTLAQSLLHPDERRKNMRGAFVFSPAYVDRIHGKHVGVVDDVMTTGETLEEVARLLKRFGAVRVTNLVFARPLP